MASLLVTFLAATAVLAAPGKKLSAREIAGIPLTDMVSPIRKASVNPAIKNTPVGAAYRNFPNLASASPAAADANSPKGIARAADRQIEYLTDVTLGTKNYSLIVDTGSSDTWSVQAQFRCVDPYSQRTVSTSECNFGPLFQGGFPSGENTNQIFAVQYGSADGPFVQGAFGYADVTVAGVTVKKQQIALALEGAWRGDQISSGILGLGLAPLTGAYNAITGKAETYDPLVVTMSKNGATPPIFALALDRDPTKSFLSLGGLPDIQTGPFASTPIVKAQGGIYARYTIQPDKFVLNTSTGSTTLQNPQVIIDSGTTLNMLPSQMAAAINKAFDPPAVYNTLQGQYFVKCDAKPPAFGIQIGGQIFWTDPSNLILPQVVDSRTGMCSTGITGTDGAPYILGDAFMQGVVSVFDISSKMEIRFAKRA